MPDGHRCALLSQFNHRVFFEERSKRTRLLSLALCIAVAAAAQADVVTEWTGELIEAIRVVKPAPPAATAAHDVLVVIYPARSANFAARLAADLAAIPDGAPKSLGIAWGAAIIGWDAKYTFDFWRPVTGIHGASADGDPHTRKNFDWTPLIPTPPFPAYISGHSTFSGAASRILALFFGTDELAFATTSNALPGVVREFTSLSAAAEEAGQSRVYGGIHWQFDNVEGLRSGRLAADEIFAQHFVPANPAVACTSSATEICALGRFLIRASWSHQGLDPHSASAIVDTGQAGRFWFFDAANTELVIKVVDGCDFNERF